MILYLFDIDGTLLHAHGSGRDSFDAVMAEHHNVANASDGIQYGGKTDHALVDELFLARLGRVATPAERVAFLDAYLPRLRARLAIDGVELLAGAVEALDFLAASARCVLGIATGNVRAGADAKLAAAKLQHRFELGGYGCDAHIRAELVATAIRRARVRHPIEEVVVVGDTVHDIAAARACGATVCAVATGTDPADALAHADVVFAALTELPAWHAARFAAAQSVG